MSDNNLSKIGIDLFERCAAPPLLCTQSPKQTVKYFKGNSVVMLNFSERKSLFSSLCPHDPFEHQISHQIPLPCLSGMNVAPPERHSRDPQLPRHQKHTITEISRNRNTAEKNTQPAGFVSCFNDLIHSVLLHPKLPSVSM